MYKLITPFPNFSKIKYQENTLKVLLGFLSSVYVSNIIYVLVLERFLDSKCLDKNM